MRILFVLEILGSTGGWLPLVGFKDKEKIDDWMLKFTPAEVRAQTDRWRIVTYVPQVVSIDEGPLIH